MFICIVFIPLDDSTFSSVDIHFFHADAFLFMGGARIKKNRIKLCLRYAINKKRKRNIN